MKVKFMVILLALAKLCDSNDVRSKIGEIKGRGILNGVSFPNWSIGNGRKTQELHKPEQRFWPPVQKESRCKSIKFV